MAYGKSRAGENPEKQEGKRILEEAVRKAEEALKEKEKWKKKLLEKVPELRRRLANIHLQVERKRREIDVLLASAEAIDDMLREITGRSE